MSFGRNILAGAAGSKPFCGRIPGWKGQDMKELMRTNDVVLLSFVRSLLDGAGIEYLSLDDHMSVIEGSLGVLPRRILVAEDQMPAALALMRANNLSHELRHTNG